MKLLLTILLFSCLSATAQKTAKVKTPPTKTDTVRIIDTVFMPLPSTPGTVTRLTIDSVDKRLKVAEAAQAAYTKRIANLENPELSTLKVSQWGLPLLTISKDGTFILRSVVIGPGLTGKLTDSAIVISVQATKATTITKKKVATNTKKK